MSYNYDYDSSITTTYIIVGVAVGLSILVSIASGFIFKGKVREVAVDQRRSISAHKAPSRLP